MNEGFLNRDKAVYSITLTLYPRGYGNDKLCHKIKTFKMNIIKTHDLRIGFTRIYGGENCYASRNKNTGYNVSSYQRVRDFTYSDEVKLNIPSMFPVKKIDSKPLKYRSITNNYDYIEGHCNNKFARERKNTVGLLSDIAELEHIRASLNYHKLIAVVPRSYFAFHRGKDNTVGFMILPVWRNWKWYWFFGRRWFKSGFLGGSWNIAFVSEDEVDEGTVAHELAHTLGQGREFYEDGELCHQFKRNSLKPCENYKIPRALKVWGRQSWQFLIDKTSIMSANKKGNINNLWIDRDTYQKTFQLLSKKVVVPNNEELYEDSIVFYRRKEKESSLKVIITGFYYEKEKDFLIPDIKVRKTKLSTYSFYPKTENTKIPVVIFQLKEGDKLVQQIKRPVFKMQMKTFYKNNEEKTEGFEFSPLISALNLPKNYRERNLRIVVLDPWKKEIYSSLVPKKIRRQLPK